MLLSFKYRLYPTQSQRNVLDYLLETHRRIYNDALKERMIAYKHAGKPVSVTYRMQADQLKAIRKFDEHAAFANFSSLQQTLRRLQKAYEAFFRRAKAGEHTGFPRFKGKGWFKSFCYVYGDGIRLDGDRLVVQRVGAIRMFQHRELPGSVKMVVLKRDGHGNWYAVFQTELPAAQPAEGELSSVGIDMGLLSFAALSAGEEIKNPRFFRQAEKDLAHLQRLRARCTKGSARYVELSKRITRLHERTANQRRDFQHKLSREIVNRYNLVFVETLNVEAMKQSNLAKSISDASWSQFLFFLRYKAENAGGASIEVKAAYTSQTCPACGCIVAKTLNVRTHDCPDCGYVASRDVAAAQVIELRGLAGTLPGRKGNPTSNVAEWVARSSPL